MFASRLARTNLNFSLRPSLFCEEREGFGKERERESTAELMRNERRLWTRIGRREEEFGLGESERRVWYHV